MNMLVKRFWKLLVYFGWVLVAVTTGIGVSIYIIVKHITLRLDVPGCASA
jgi:hypothetical protein